MRHTLVALALAACTSSKPTTTTPIGNAPPDDPNAVKQTPPAKKTAVTCKIARPATLSATTTSGTIAGGVCDDKTGEVLAGTTVIATSDVLQGSQAAITDENGVFFLVNLPPGDYIVTFYYAEVTLETKHVVRVDNVTWFTQPMKSTSSGETIRIDAM